MEQTRKIHSRLTKSQSSFTSQSGFTIAEIVIVLVILGILFSVLTGGLFKSGDQAKARITGIKMNQVKGFLDQYRLQYSNYPSSLSGLYDCGSQGSFCVQFASEEDLKDAWESPFTYSSDGRTYTLKSLGSDKAPGGSGGSADLTLTGP